jgi:hypothetical protein
MRNLLNPKWLFIINTLPIVVLFIMLFGQFNIVKTLLDSENIRHWNIFGLALGFLGLSNFLYAVYLILKKQDIPLIYAAVALFCYIVFVYSYVCHFEDIMPFNVPQWMVSENLFIYVGTFLMPTIIYSLFILIIHFTSTEKEHKAWVNFLIAIGVPVIGYLFYLIIFPLWRFGGDFEAHSLFVLIIVATLVFLFFLVRGIFIIASKKAVAWKKYQLIWKIPFTILFPLLGLLVNNGFLFDKLSYNDSGIFGDFNNSWFYILAIVNGILLCLPNLENKIYRLLLFLGRSITFAYTFYFFLVLLPFLPLSVIAIIAFGAGFLMLTPLVLFVIHINELSIDFKYLKTFFSKKLAIAVSLLGFLVIPAFITTNYLKDKSVLNETLDYLYNPNYSKQYNIDKNSLQKTLNVLKHHKSRNNDFIISSNKIPYLSSYFNWLVLDNLTLSDAKINHIEKVFFGKTSFDMFSENIQNDNVEITDIATNSTYDKSQNAWISWVDLEITNHDNDRWFSEYATTIDLPEGCWISDYYLYVGDRKEFGILAEKKSAMWVFSQIRNENRDPGILYYLTGNKVAFRVFPFAEGEVRRTGIEFLHKEPVKLIVDNNILLLGNVEETVTENIETENVIYVSAEQKKSLNQVQREPYFHFLVDVSKDKDAYSSDFTTRIKQFLENNKSLSEKAQISFVNSYVNTIPLNNDWKQDLETQTFEGGFYLDRAIKTTLFNAYKNTSHSYPIIVVVTDDIQNAVLDKDFSDFKFAFPENDLFFNLAENGYLMPHSLVKNPIKSLSVNYIFSFDQNVLEYQTSVGSTVYLPDNNKPSIILKNDIFKTKIAEIKEKNWQSALTMQAHWNSQILHPETSDKEWLNLIKYSFTSKVMTPVTSYLVVENEAQKAILKKKQEQVLSGNKSLDLSEDIQRMSEPELILLTILFGLVLWFIKKRKQ